jgi:putative transposase
MLTCPRLSIGRQRWLNRQKINPAYTGQRCSACGHVASQNRKSQAVFACTACGYTGNADVNAAKNIAAGHAVTARGGL